MRPMRLAIAVSVLAVVGGMAFPVLTPVNASAAPSARRVAAAATCTPSIHSVGRFQAQATQSVEIKGSCSAPARP